MGQVIPISSGHSASETQPRGAEAAVREIGAAAHLIAAAANRLLAEPLAQGRKLTIINGLQTSIEGLPVVVADLMATTGDQT